MDNNLNNNENFNLDVNNSQMLNSNNLQNLNSNVETNATNQNIDTLGISNSNLNQPVNDVSNNNFNNINVEQSSNIATQNNTKKFNFKILIIILIVLIIGAGLFFVLTNKKESSNVTEFNSVKKDEQVTGHRIISYNDLDDSTKTTFLNNVNEDYPRFGKLVLENSKVYYKGRFTQVDDDINYYEFTSNINNFWLYPYIDFNNWVFLVSDEQGGVHKLIYSYSASPYSPTDGYTEYNLKDWNYYYNIESGEIFGNYKLNGSWNFQVKFKDDQLTSESNIIDFIKNITNNISMENFKPSEDEEMITHIRKLFSVKINKLDDSKFVDFKLNDEYSLKISDKYIYSWGTVYDMDNLSYNLIKVIPSDLKYNIVISEFKEGITLDDIKNNDSIDSYSQYNYDGIDMTIATVDTDVKLLQSINGSFAGFILKIDDTLYKFNVDNAVEKVNGKDKDVLIKYIFDNLLIRK